MSAFQVAFSGGGFRAAFFCLGAYRRLVELGVHDQVKLISSVSGGSITAALIMKELAKGTFHDTADFDARVGRKLVRFGKAGFRNRVLRQAYTPFRSPLRPFLPRARFSRTSPIVFDQRLLGRELLDDTGRRSMELHDLPEEPKWICNATNLQTLKRFSFSRDTLADEVFGTSKEVDGITVADAVAASSAFPLLFEPVRLNIKERPFSLMREDYSHFLLTDGGVYDNIGSEELLLDAEGEGKERVPYMMFDASARQSLWPPKEWQWWGKRQLRIMNVSMDQVAELRKRLIRKHTGIGVQLLNVETINENKQFQTTYWVKYLQERSLPNQLQLPEYSEEYEEIERMLARVRTDLDRFHDIEIGMLMWAGAMRADLGFKVLQSLGALQAPPGSPPVSDVPKRTDYVSERYSRMEIRRKLRRSHKRCLFRLHRRARVLT
ncbi:patatin-like phospholipase family protein [Alkalicoccus chagannorensis]|uniref:patatin-like phospholipase family protein n=1 Tax=Alkalicoccus chagannorensis TaxID=427072 RepID=UPI00040670F1|nr:patatin-like phospholipase family protein [Alkalicoccus chagannorensis]